MAINVFSVKNGTFVVDSGIKLTNTFLYSCGIVTYESNDLGYSSSNINFFGYQHSQS